MEKMDIAIAAAGAVVLVLAITGSALYGGTGVTSGGALAVTFPTTETALDAQGFSTQGSGESEVTFTVPMSNLTRIVFTAAASDPSGQASPSIRLVAESPEGATYESDSGTLEIPIAVAPEPMTALGRDDLPAPAPTGTGAWTLIVQVTSALPVPVPYQGEASATVTTYAAAIGPSDGVTR